MIWIYDRAELYSVVQPINLALIYIKKLVGVESGGKPSSGLSLSRNVSLPLNSGSTRLRGLMTLSAPPLQIITIRDEEVQSPPLRLALYTPHKEPVTHSLT